MSDEQLSRIQERLAAIEKRLDAIEGTHRSAATPPPLPNFPEPTPPLSLRLSTGPVAPPVIAPSMAKSPAPARVDTEYDIGAKILPRVGAVVFVAGIIYLVSIFISRGLITPQMQFAGELILCGIFVGLGLWKINEREDFGQVLVAIGSCGLFASFAAAESFKRLIPGSSVVAAYICIGLLVLLFSYWRTSKFFLFLGLVGGFAGALMPLTRGSDNLSTVLTFIIILPALAIVLDRKWFQLVGVLYALSAATLSASISYQPGWVCVAVVYGNAILHLCVYARTFKALSFDPRAALSGLMIFSAGFHAFAYLGDLSGSAHIALFCAAAAALPLILTENRQLRATFAVASLVTFAAIAPFGVAKDLRLLAYDGTAIAVVALAFVLRKPSLVAISWMAAFLSMAMYWYVIFSQVPGVELRNLLALIATFTVTLWATVRLKAVEGASIAPAMVTTFLLLGPFAMRAIFIMLPGVPHRYFDLDRFTTSALLYATVLILLGLAMRLGSAVAVAWGFLATTLCSYLMSVVDRHEPMSDELALVSMILVATLLNLLGTARWKRTTNGILLGGAMLIWPLTSRAVVLVLANTGMSASAAVTISWTLYALLLIAIGFAWRQRELRWAALIVFGSALSKVVLFDLVALDAGIRVAVLMALGAAMIAGGYWYIRIKKAHESSQEA